jgi:hypothetical protein
MLSHILQLLTNTVVGTLLFLIPQTADNAAAVATAQVLNRLAALDRDIAATYATKMESSEIKIAVIRTAKEHGWQDELFTAMMEQLGYLRLQRAQLQLKKLLLLKMIAQS